MKAFFLFLLLICSGLAFATLMRPAERLAKLFSIPQHLLSRLIANRPSFQGAGVPRTSSPVPRHVAHFKA